MLVIEQGVICVWLLLLGLGCEDCSILVFGVVVIVHYELCLGFCLFVFFVLLLLYIEYCMKFNRIYTQSNYISYLMQIINGV